MIQGATSDEEMDVRVIAEISGPGVEHAHQTESATDKARVLGQLQQGLGGRAEEQVVDRLLLRASQGPQLGGQGEGDQEVRDGQQQLLLLVQPLIGLLVAALGTVPVLAGVISCNAPFDTGDRNRLARRERRCGIVRCRAWPGDGKAACGCRTSPCTLGHAAGKYRPLPA